MKSLYNNLLNENINNFNLEYYNINKNLVFQKKEFNKKEFREKIKNIIINLENYSNKKKYILILENCIEIIFLIYSLMILGKKIIVINPDELKKVKNNLINQNKEAILISKKIIDSKKKHKTLIVENLLKDAKKEINLSKYLKKINYDNLSLSYCSSGTTSSPKLINLNRRNISSQLEQIRERLKVDRLKDKFLTAMPCTHISAFFFIFLNGIIFDKKVIFLNYFNPIKFAELLRKEKISLSYLNPTMIEILNEYIKHSITLKNTVILSGSAPLAKNVLKKFLKKTKCKFIHLYGLTETTNTACVMPSNRHKNFYRKLYFNENIPSVGTPLKACNIKLFHNNKFVNQPNCEGELLISGPNVIKPQKDRSSGSKFSFKGKYLKTGDVGFFKKFGKEKFFFLTGRIKEMIIKNGINIYLNEIDNFLKNKGLVKTVSVRRKSRFSGEDYHLVTDSPKEFKVNLSKTISELPKYMRTNKVILVKQLIRTLSGKVKKNAIYENLINKKDFKIKEKDF